MKQSLHIGLNYRNSPYELGGCENDATLMIERSPAKNLNARIQFDMSSVDFISELILLRAKAHKSSTTLITFSGHGTQWTDHASQEADKQEEGLCFWNGSEIEVLPDNDFRALVRSIPGIVFVVLDSCFSGGMDRNAQKPPDPFGEWKRRFIQFDPETMRINRRHSQSRANVERQRERRRDFHVLDCGQHGQVAPGAGRKK